MILFLILPLLIFDVVATPIATPNNNQRIIGGFDAYAGQFPYQVSIRYVPYANHFCSGSIINNRWILTSAYCVNIYPSSEISAVVGSHYLSSGGTTHKILFKVGHPDSDDVLLNNVGLLRVNGQISYSDLVKNVQPTSASTSTDLPFTISGWGSETEKPHFDILQYVIQKSIPIDVCAHGFPVEIPVYDAQHICTNSITGQGLGVYDLGSPLVYNGEQYGIASIPGFGFRSDIYTKVASFNDWIKGISNT